MVSSLLGLRADAFNGRLQLVRPVLPESVSELEFRRIKVGKASLDLRFERTSSGEVKVRMRKHGGPIQVEFDENERQQPAA